MDDENMKRTLSKILNAFCINLIQNILLGIVNVSCGSITSIYLQTALVVFETDCR